LTLFAGIAVVVLAARGFHSPKLNIVVPLASSTKVNVVVPLASLGVGWLLSYAAIKAKKALKALGSKRADKAMEKAIKALEANPSNDER
jgi:hypothetical protein